MDPAWKEYFFSKTILCDKLHDSRTLFVRDENIHTHTYCSTNMQLFFSQASGKMSLRSR